MPRPHRFGLFGVALAGFALLGAPALAQPPAKPDAAQVAPAAAPDPGVRTLHTGTLQAGDTQLESGEYYDEYILDGAVGDEIIAVLSALDFDPYLILILPSGEQLDNDDFSGSRDISLIEVPVETPGRHALRVTSYAREETGEYALMAGTRMADGIDAGSEDFDVEPETFDVKGPIEIGRQISGTLGEDDPVRTDGSHYEGYSFQGQEGANIVVTLTSADFDAYLTLVRPSGTTQENDDQGEGSTDSRIELTLDESGEWIVVANTLIAGETGDYRLTISRR